MKYVTNAFVRVKLSNAGISTKDQKFFFYMDEFNTFATDQKPVLHVHEDLHELLTL